MNEAALISRLQKLLGKANRATKQLRFREAEQLYRECLAIAPQHVQVLWNLGVLMQRRADSPAERREAMDFYHDCIKYSAGDTKIASSAFTNMGAILGKIDKIAEAKICYGLARQMNPDNLAAKNNFADILRHDGHYSEANKEFLEVLELDPECASAKFSTGMISLLLGDLKRGFELYESRFDVASFPTKKFKSEKPEWNGEDLNGKTLLVLEEQGFGDTFMFCRYFSELKEKHPECEIWFRGNILYRNIAKGIIGLDRFFTVEDSLASMDYFIHILSLPHRFGTTLEMIQQFIPYILKQLDWGEWWPTAFSCRNDFAIDKRIGICWAGSPRHGKDKWRSLTPESFQPVIDAHPEIQFYSLQVGPRAWEFERLKNVIDLAPTISDFTDTAQAILQLDLVISVDTAVGHLAGALDKPCWLLLPHSPDWRWMLEREDSPWYPRHRLFRQQGDLDWEPVLQRINEEL